MKITIFVAFFLVLWGGHYLHMVSSTKVPVSKMIKATSKLIKGTPQLNLPSVLPKLPPMAVGQAKKILRLRDRVGPEAWKKVEKSVDFFRKMKSALKSQNITSYDKPPVGWNWNEILWCHPADQESRCFSTCQRKGYTFKWCYTSAAQDKDWQHCACEIRPSVRHWIHLAKTRLVHKSQVLADTPVTQEGKNETIQWIVIATLAFLVIVLVTGIIARVVYNYRRAQDAEPPNIVIVDNVELEEL